MDNKKCSKCGEIKSLDYFYTKGANRRDARCKPCVIQLKREDRGILNRKKGSPQIDNHKHKISCSLEDKIFYSAEFWNAVIKASHDLVFKKRQKAIIDFQNSKMTVQEFNNLHYRDDGQLFPRIENGDMEMTIVTKLEGVGGNAVHSERALKLYHDNLSMQEISKILNRSEKWIQRSLAKFGLKFGPGGNRFDPMNIPYGWKEKDGKLVLNESEQWILSKIEEDLKKNVPLKKICRSINGLKIKTRESQKWDEAMLAHVVSKNKKLRFVLLPRDGAVNPIP